MYIETITREKHSSGAVCFHAYNGKNSRCMKPAKGVQLIKSWLNRSPEHCLHARQAQDENARYTHYSLISTYTR